MKPTDTPHTQVGSIPTPGSYPLYEYPAYTFDKKYENDEFQKKVITIDNGYHLVEKPRDFDPLGQTGFAHLWLQYD